MELPDEVFRYTNTETAIMNEQTGYTEIDRIDITENGIFIYFEGAEYPYRGLSTPKFLASANVVKRMFIEGVRLASHWFMVPLWLFVLILPQKIKVIEKFLVFFADVGYKVMREHVLKDEMMLSFGRELEWFVYSFMNNVGFKPKLCKKISEMIACIIEGDNAYRLRVIDLFEILDVDRLLKHPAKEIKRAVAVFSDRESDKEVAKKFKQFSQIIVVLLYVPTIRKAFVKTIKKINFENIRYDKVEKYWACLRTDGYKYLGATDEERKKFLGDAKIPVLKYR